jgi:hypothetical protein
MAKGFSKPTVAIQRLLDERRQIQTWLERLAMAADKTPEHVRARVRADYEKRLADVMRELQGHGSELKASMDRLRAVEAGLAKQENEAAERLAEAELRHAVGEYDEAQWRQVHADLLGGLVKIREELKQAGEEIRRLDEVLGMIEKAPPAAPPAPVPAPEAAKGPEAPMRKKEAGRPKPEATDELAFLRSVTEDEMQGPAPARASGAMREMPDLLSSMAQPGAEAGGAEGAKEGASRPSKAAKSLKCSECGTLNLPTEWYCERCGAELAAL